MNQPDERSLFTLSAPDAQEYLDEILGAAAARSTYQAPVARALLLAEAAAQKVTLKALQRRERRALRTQTAALETVERIVALYFEGEPARIDLLTWDREGFIHGWSFSKGQPVSANTLAYPATVRALVCALKSLAASLPDWRALLEQHAATLEGLLKSSRARARAVAAQRVNQPRWWQRLLGRRVVAREMASLGFH